MTSAQYHVRTMCVQKVFVHSIQWNICFKIGPNDLILFSFLMNLEKLVCQMTSKKYFGKVAVGWTAKKKVKVTFYNFFIWANNETLNNTF